MSGGQSICAARRAGRSAGRAHSKLIVDRYFFAPPFGRASGVRSLFFQ
jgi:hypothetical protein